jgi:hypothetical protein
MSTKRQCAALLSAMLGGLAHAEPKLFPTDLLTPRQADAAISLDAMRSAGDIRANALGLPGAERDHASTLSMDARYGITYALTLGAGLQAGSANAYLKLNNGQRVDAHEDGLLASRVYARYAIVPETRGGAYALTTDVLLSHQHNPEGSTSFNVYGFNATLSARTTDLVRTYATLGFSVPSKGYASRDLTAAAGGWMQVNPGVVGTLELGARRRVANSTTSSANSTAATVSGIWDVATGTSVRASLSVSRTSGSTAQNGGLTVRPSQGQRLGVSLYHLY